MSTDFDDILDLAPALYARIAELEVEKLAEIRARVSAETEIKAADEANAKLTRKVLDQAEAFRREAFRLNADKKSIKARLMVLEGKRELKNSVRDEFLVHMDWVDEAAFVSVRAFQQNLISTQLVPESIPSEAIRLQVRATLDSWFKTKAPRPGEPPLLISYAQIAERAIEDRNTTTGYEHVGYDDPDDPNDIWSDYDEFGRRTIPF